MKKIVIISAVFITVCIGLMISFDKLFMPWFVSAEEVVVPNVVGMDRDAASKILSNLSLNPMQEGPRYDNQNPRPENQIILQRPRAGEKVKINRRIYIFYSGGEPKVTMPYLVGKTYRDAGVTLSRLDLKIGDIRQQRDELPVNTIIGQNFETGTLLEKGSLIDIIISTGPKLGSVYTPLILGKSIGQAKRILGENSLFIGRIKYQHSSTLLSNTIMDQDPSENTLIKIGDSVRVTVSRKRR